MGDKDYFLSPDDAMTMGDIDYMRTSKRTRRTFPKTLKNKDGFALDNEVSSVQDNNRYKSSNTNQNNTVNTVFNPTPSSASQPGATGGSAVTQTNPVQPKEDYNFQSESKPAAPAPQSSFQASQPSSEERRQTDDSMDMFRNMAKKMRGGR